MRQKAHHSQLASALRAATIFICACVASTFGATPQHGISAKELDELARILALSDAQTVRLKQLYTDYSSRWEQSIAAEMKEYSQLRERSINAISGAESGPAPNLRDLQLEVDRRREAIWEKVGAINGEFFAQVVLMLTPEQTERIEQAKLSHDRSWLRRPPTGFRESHVDLIALFEKSQFGAAAQEAAQAILVDYADQLVPLARQSFANYEEHWLLQAEIAELLRPYATGGVAPPADVTSKMYQMQFERDKKTLPIYGRIVALNRSSLKRLREALSADDGAQLERAYNESAYPEVYPDPADATVLYEAAARLGDLIDDQRQSLVVEQSIFDQQHVSLSRKMAESIFKRGVASVRMRPETVDDEVSRGWQELKDLGERRERLDQAQLRQIRAILLPDQMTRLPAWDFATNPPRRPWDPKDTRPAPPTKPQTASTQPATTGPAATQPAAVQPP